MQHDTSRSGPLRLFDQLKQRNVVRVAVLYLVGCWLILEPTHVVFHMLEVPAWANRLVLILMAIGLPAVMLFAWVYEITPEGLKPTAEVEPDKSIRPLTGRRLDRSIIVVLGLALAYFVADRFWFKAGPVPLPQASTPSVAPSVAPSAAAFSPPAHSVAVLPFVNLSGDPKQDYFSDGLSEELLNSLTRVRDLQVAARTSSFSFKGKESDAADIARKLNVGALLEGSVRKDGLRVRINTQLINAVSGFNLWSQTYDRNLRDILAVQTEVASAVTQALQAKLLQDPATLAEEGGTHDPRALDAYLRARNMATKETDAASVLARIATFDEAIRLDSKFASAHEGRARALTWYGQYYASVEESRRYFDRARASAEKALALSPNLGEAHATYAVLLDGGFLDFGSALREYEQALALSPNNPWVLVSSGIFFSQIGRLDQAVLNARRGAALDLLNPSAHWSLSTVLFAARRYREAAEAADRALSLNKDEPGPAGARGLAYLMAGDLESARTSCEPPLANWNKRLCLALVYQKLHRRADAEAQVAAMHAELGDSSAYQYAEIYAQWGDLPRSLQWLETAYRLRDPGLSGLKVDPLMDPLRREPRFLEMERKLKFPPGDEAARRA